MDLQSRSLYLLVYPIAYPNTPLSMHCFPQTKMFKTKIITLRDWPLFYQPPCLPQTPNCSSDLAFLANLLLPPTPPPLTPSPRLIYPVSLVNFSNPPTLCIDLIWGPSPFLTLVTYLSSLFSVLFLNHFVFFNHSHFS